jgi:hypothetical protein
MCSGWNRPLERSARDADRLKIAICAPAKYAILAPLDFIYIVALAILLYVLASLRVLRQYERGVVLRRAKIVAAEGEYQGEVKLGEAADIITQHPVALQLRTLQTMAEISIEKNSTIIFPAQFMTTVQAAIAILSKDSASK